MSLPALPRLAPKPLALAEHAKKRQQNLDLRFGTLTFYRRLKSKLISEVSRMVGSVGRLSQTVLNAELLIRLQILG